MQKYNDINEVWAAIDQDKIIYWGNKSYELTIEPSQLEWRKRNNFAVPFSNKDDKCLRVTCTSNWLGSLLESDEISSLFSE